ncbi:hypothetical protein [Pseudodesulfovibrio tunisiensis]|uniref:hypothetical protein n=1 Tax=Pseudodesulfovibrio tunisiensis TaxID=463192 RepID=UPI001FB51878|nr:hypothetical protein [Pseudodesulfovibrio tunisiensis]
MKKQVYIHIGMPKTGSTSIQHYIYLNREKMARRGVFYDVGERQKESHAHLISESNNGFLEIAGLGCQEAAWKRLLKKANHSNCEKIVVSSELFSAYVNNYFITEESVQLIKGAVPDN